MDTYMDVYFEEIFNNLGRDSLNEKNKRRELVDYFCTVIAGCAKGNLFIFDIYSLVLFSLT